MSDFANSTPQASNGSADIGSHLQDTKNSAYNTAQSTASSIQNSETVQSLSSGPVAETAKDQANKTTSEFQNIADARTTPSQPAATGQPLTHYHSMFYNLLSWENPRASGIAFAVTVLLILTARYLHVLHYAFKAAAYVLGATASLEIAGKVLFDNGLATRIRPRKYWTIPREALERSLEDVEQLLNFFVIESQRILFAENVPVTIAAFVAALVSYGLIKFVPFWGLCLISTCVLFLAPLIYVQNRETIDNLLNEGSTMLNQQTGQIKDLTAHHTSRATASVKAYAGEYSSKAQNYMGSSKASISNGSLTGSSPLSSSADGPLSGISQSSSVAQEHTLKPSEVAGTTDAQSLPSPPSGAPSSGLPSVPQSDFKQESVLATS